jgi:hypothetical protein
VGHVTHVTDLFPKKLSAKLLSISRSIIIIIVHGQTTAPETHRHIASMPASLEIISGELEDSPTRRLHACLAGDHS